MKEMEFLPGRCRHIVAEGKQNQYVCLQLVENSDFCSKCKPIKEEKVKREKKKEEREKKKQEEGRKNGGQK